jgi:SulP family sulfate permease
MKTRIKKALPILEWLPNYRRSQLGGDVTAGLTTAVMLIPQGMAYAMLAGLPPHVGLYASIVPMLVYALFGTSRQLSVGPVAMDSLLVIAGVSVLAEPGTEEYIGYAITLALMVGLIQVLMGVFRMGFFVNFLSRPTVTGFTAAAALIIGSSQLGPLMGIDAERKAKLFATLGEIWRHLGEVHLATLVIGGGALLMLLAFKRWAKKLPAALIVVIVTTIAVIAFGLEASGVATIGNVPSGLPGFEIPSFEFGDIPVLGGTALAIALVSFMETISVGRKFAQKFRYDLRPNQELIGVGAGNLTGSFFGGYPVAGGLSRTAVNADAGAKTPLASLITAATIALALLFFTGWFVDIPKATLAAIIIAAVSGLVDVTEMKRLWKVKRPDFGVMLLTFIATIALGIQMGILIGVGISIALFVFRTTRPHAARLGRVPQTSAYRNIKNYPQAITWDGLLLVRVDAQFYFGNVTFLKDTLTEFEKEMDSELRSVIIDASSINQLDSSADAAIHEIARSYAERGIELYFANVKQPVRNVMEASGFWQQLGEDHFFLSVHDAVQCVLGKGDFCTDLQARNKERKDDETR